MRRVGCNRHGHTVDLRFPGPMGWTKAYAMARRSNLIKTDRGPASGPARKIIPQMKRYTEFGTEVRYASAPIVARLQIGPRALHRMEQRPRQARGGCGRGRQHWPADSRYGNPVCL